MRRNRYKQHLVKEEESDLPEDIYTEFIPDEKEDERCAKEIKCENKQTEYRYCGKDLPKIGVRAGDSMDDVFENINNSIKNIPTALTVEVKNTNGNTVVTQEVDTLNNVINFPDTEVQLKDNNGNIISNNYLPSGVIGSITAPACPTITADVSNSVGAVVDSGSVAVGGVIHLNAPDATYELLNSNNVQQDSGNIPSNENLQIFAQDATYTVENSQGALQSSGSIASGESGIISAQDARVFVNYTDGTYIDDAYIPSGDSLTVSVPNPSGWYRPSEWIDVPAPLTNEVIFLFAVYENAPNQIALSITTSIANTARVDIYNEGATTPFATYSMGFNNITVNWSDCLPSSYFAGRNYRQCYIKVSVTSGNIDQFSMVLGHATYGTNKIVNLLEAQFNLPNANTNVSIGNQGFQNLIMLESVIFLTLLNANNGFGRWLQGLTVLKKFIVPNGTILDRDMQAAFMNCGLEYLPTNWTLQPTITASMFNTSKAVIAEVDMVNCVLTGNMFTGALTQEITLLNCDNITTSISSFSLANLHRLILQNYKLSFTIANSLLLKEQAQLNLVNSLADLTGGTAQTIIMTGLPSYPSVQALATSKNWNLV